MHPVIIQEQPPAQDALRIKITKRVVLVVGVDRDVWTSVQHCTILFESFNERENFFLTNRVVPLRAV